MQKVKGCRIVRGEEGEEGEGVQRVNRCRGLTGAEDQ